jgi:hypothetical protein
MTTGDQIYDVGAVDGRRCSPSVLDPRCRGVNAGQLLHRVGEIDRQFVDGR